MIIGAVSALPFLLVVIIILNVAIRPATCFDGRHNGEELDIDCGGACELYCPQEVTPLRLLWARPFQVTEDVVSMVAYLEHQNPAAGIKSIAYEFQLLDEAGQLVGEPIQGRTSIGPSERTAIFESGVNVGDTKVDRVLFSFLEEQAWYKADPEVAYTQLVVRSRDLVAIDGRPRLNVEIENTTLKTLQDVFVVALLYDQNDNAIGASRTYVSRIGASERKSIFFTWPEPLGIPIARTEVIAHLDPFVLESK